MSEFVGPPVSRAGSGIGAGIGTLLGGPVGGLLGSIAGGLFSARSARRRNRQQVALAREQMAFQERMSSTAFQRAARDLEKAGLNRILALGKPASSPGGQMAPVIEELAPGLNSALAIRRQNLELANMRETNRLTRAQTDVARMNAHNIGARTTLTEALSAIPRAVADLVNSAREVSGTTTKGGIKKGAQGIVDKTLTTGQKVYEKLRIDEPIRMLGDLFEKGEKGHNELIQYWYGVGKRQGMSHAEAYAFARRKAK